MKIEFKPKRILAMIAIGMVFALLQLAIGMKPSGALIGGVLFFVWIWLGGGSVIRFVVKIYKKG